VNILNFTKLSFIDNWKEKKWILLNILLVGSIFSISLLTTVISADVSTFEFTFGSSGNGDGQFANPRGAAITSSNNIIIADGANSRIQIFDSSGNFLFMFGGQGSGPGEFGVVRGVAVDSMGRIIVADSSQARIQVFDSFGNFLFTFGSLGPEEGQFNLPVGIGIDSSDRIIVADGLNDRVQVFDSFGNFVTVIGSSGTGTGQFDYPTGLAIDSSDRIIVAENLNNRVQIFDSSGNFITTFGSNGTADGEFFFPAGVAVDSSDQIYVVETLNHRAQVFDPSGNHLLTIGSPGSGPGQFSKPFGIAIDNTERVIIVDAGNNRIQVFSALSPITAPDAVTDLALTVISENQVDLSWSLPSDNGSAITGYLIDRNHQTLGITTLETSYGDATTTSYSDTSLSAGDMVTYRIAAINSAGTATFSNVPLSVVTAIPVPNGVTDLSLNVISENQVDSSWTIPADNGSPITGYLIQRSLNGGGAETLETSFGDATTTSYSDTTLSPGDAVQYRIAAINAVGTAPLSNIPPNVVTPIPVPDSVTDLALTVISENQVDLSWIIPADNGSPITGYVIDSKVNGVVSTIETSFGDATTTSYSDTSLSAGDMVTYRIAAINAGGTAPYSNIPPPVTTLATVPDMINDLSLTVISSNQVDLSWSLPSDNGSPIIGYHVFRNLNLTVVTLIDTIIGDTAISYSDTTLSSGDQVIYAVRAVNAIGSAPFSNVPLPVITP